MGGIVRGVLPLPGLLFAIGLVACEHQDPAFTEQSQRVEASEAQRGAGPEASDAIAAAAPAGMDSTAGDAEHRDDGQGPSTVGAGAASDGTSVGDDGILAGMNGDSAGTSDADGSSMDGNGAAGQGNDVSNGGNGSSAGGDAGDGDGSTSGGDGATSGSDSAGGDGPASGGDGTTSGGDGATSGGDGATPGDEGSTAGDGDGSAGGEGPIGDSGSGSEGTINLPQLVTRSMTFSTQVLGQGSVTQDLDAAYQTTDITLTSTVLDRSRAVAQIARPLAVDNFEQGNSGAAESQTFEQVANRLLDIVVVIDDSGSMAQEQQNMATKLSPLLSYVQDSDWQIGVVTTDPDEGCLRSLIRKGDANPAQAFSQAVTAGTGHSGNERGVLQAVRAMAGTCLPQTWLRADSTVAVLIVSDEDNCSANGADCPDKDYATASYLYNYLASIRQPGANARVYGLIWHPSETHTQCASAYNKATVYADVIANTAGTWGSICASDYSPTLSRISQDIMVVLNSKFTLTYQPVAGSVHVFVGGNEITSGVTVNGKVVEISPAPAPGSQIVINYRHGATSIVSNFILRYTPEVSTLTVAVNGQTADPQTYQVDASNKKVTFGAAPAEYAAIAVTYTRNESPLPARFDIGESFLAGSVSARVGGVARTDFTTDASGLTFQTAPLDGAWVEIFYRITGDPILIYPFAGPTPVNLVANDAATDDPMNVIYADNHVRFDAGDFAQGRVIRLRYDNEARQSFEVILPAVPLPGVTATGGTTVCTSADQIVVTNQTVSIDGCHFGSDVTNVQVDYSYLVSQVRDFTFAGDDLPVSGAYQVWRVFVDGTETTDFTRTGNVISFSQDLPFGSTVRVDLTQEGH